MEEDIWRESESQMFQPEVLRASAWPGAGSHWNWWLETMLQMRESWSVKTPDLRVRTGVPVQEGRPLAVLGEISCRCEGGS